VEGVSLTKIAPPVDDARAASTPWLFTDTSAEAEVRLNLHVPSVQQLLPVDPRAPHDICKAPDGPLSGDMDGNGLLPFRNELRPTGDSPVDENESSENATKPVGESGDAIDVI